MVLKKSLCLVSSGGDELIDGVLYPVLVFCFLSYSVTLTVGAGKFGFFLSWLSGRAFVLLCYSFS